MRKIATVSVNDLEPGFCLSLPPYGRSIKSFIDDGTGGEKWERRSWQEDDSSVFAEFLRHPITTVATGFSIS